MCNYKMDINREINASYYETICDYMEIINDKDSFAISINGINKNNIDILQGIPIAGICAVSAIMKAGNPKLAVEELKCRAVELGLGNFKEV